MIVDDGCVVLELETDHRVTYEDGHPHWRLILRDTGSYRVEMYSLMNSEDMTKLRDTIDEQLAKYPTP